MADKEKDLELHVGMDIDDFLADLQLMDKAYQECVTDIENKKAEVRLQTSVDISAARAAGDKIAEIVARNREQNDLLKLQAEKVKFLEKGWREVAKAQGESSEKAKKAYQAYQKATIQLNNLKEKSNRSGTMQNLSFIAPDTFRKIEQVKNAIAAVSAEFPAIAKFAPALGAVGGGFAVATTAATAFYQVLKQITDASTEAAVKAAALGEETYKMKERLSLDEQTANKLSDVFRLDGTDANAVLKKVDSLGAALLTASEDGTKAEQALQRYGESLRNADGSMKNAEQALTAIAEAYKKAESAGQGYQLLAETGMGKYSTLIASWDDLIARAGKIEKAVGATTKVMHEMSDRTADAALAEKELTKAAGADAAAVRIKVLEAEIDRKNELISLQNENRLALQAYEERVGFLKTKLDSLGDTAAKVWIKIKSAMGRGIMSAGTERLGTSSAIDRELEQMLADEQKKKSAQHVREQQALQAKEKAAAQANAALEKMIWDLKASDYDKEIAKINEVAEAQRKAGADEIKVAEYVAEAKAKAAEKYATKNKQDTKLEERIRKEAEASVQAAKQASDQIQQVWMTETQKRLAEIEKQRQAWVKAGASEVEATRAAEQQKRKLRMSEAEQTLLQNVKLIRKMQQAEAQGQDPYAAGSEYLKKQYMKDNKLRESDFAGLQRYGVDNIQQMISAMKDSLYGKFAGGETTNNNTVNNTVNIDRPVVTDESFLNQLVDRVCDKLVPVMKQAYGGQQNSY